MLTNDPLGSREEGEEKDLTTSLTTTLADDAPTGQTEVWPNNFWT